MGAFVDRQGNLKNSQVIKGFSLSFLFIAVFVLGYMLSESLVARLFPAQTGDFFAVWGPPALISLICTLLCCSLMALLQDKIIVPLAFLFIALFYIIFIIASLAQSDVELRRLGARMVSLYALPPVLLGNLCSWGIFVLSRHYKKNKAAAK